MTSVTVHRLTGVRFLDLGIIERVMVIDPRRSLVRILVAERLIRTLHVRERLVVPRELDSSSDIVGELVERLRAEYAPIQIRVLLPQSEMVSQRIALRSGTIGEFVASEAERFEKIEGSAPIIDCQPIGASPSADWWLTWCSESSVEKHLQSLGLGTVDDVHGPVTALLGLYRGVPDCPPDLCVVDLDSHRTTVLRIEADEPRTASTFTNPPGLDSGTDPQAVRLWQERFRKALPSPGSKDDFLLLFGRKDMTERVADFPGREVRIPEGTPSSSPEHDLATQTAVMALASPRDCISLALPECRLQQQRTRRWSRLRGLASLLALLSLIILLGSTWYQTALIQIKTGRLADIGRESDRIHRSEDEFRQSMKHYATVIPLLRHQYRTEGLLQTLEAAGRISRDPLVWTVLLADYRTYFTHEAPASVEESPEIPPRYPDPGFILELGFSPGEKAMADRLVSLVNQLEEDHPLLLDADTLPDSDQRMLIATNVFLPGRHGTLSLRLEPDPFPDVNP